MTNTLSCYNIEVAKRYFREHPVVSLDDYAKIYHEELHCVFFMELVRLSGLYAVARIGERGLSDDPQLVAHIESAKAKAYELQKRHGENYKKVEDELDRYMRRAALLDHYLCVSENSLGMQTVMKQLPSNVLQSTVELLYLVYTNILVSPITSLQIVPYITGGWTCAAETDTDPILDELWVHSNNVIKDIGNDLNFDNLSYLIRRSVFYAQNFPREEGNKRFMAPILYLIASVAATSESESVREFTNIWTNPPAGQPVPADTHDEWVFRITEVLENNNSQISRLQNENANILVELCRKTAQRIPF